MQVLLLLTPVIPVFMVADPLHILQMLGLRYNYSVYIIRFNLLLKNDTLIKLDPVFLGGVWLGNW